MGLFDKLFSSSSELKEEKLVPWIPLTSVSQLDDVVEKSKTKTQIIFKHSTRCGISRMVFNQFEANFDVNTSIDLYYLDLLNYREVSNATGYAFKVMHESPQVLVIKNGVVVKHASHGVINDLELTKFL